MANLQFKNNETALITDQNGNHFVQAIVGTFLPGVYADFVYALTQSDVGLKSVMEVETMLGIDAHLIFYFRTSMVVA